VGHIMADMADDYANLIEEEFGGRVDLAVGESYGGCVAQYLAARHPERVGQLALVVAASRVTDAGLHFDRRLADASAAGDVQGAVDACADYLFGAGRSRLLRPALRWVIGNELAGSSACPADDIRVELAAEESFDSRSALKEITAPVLMICGDRDMFFSKQVVEETAALIPDCTLVWYRGRGHLRTAVSLRVARDIVAFATSAWGQRLAR
jgi:pimeloyl-ACP methyl ester carboxylesterase